ncbi:DUF58 domain-containing protein [Bombiscardovia apis]|uniref:DUF58 domain-containing protein n=1 Tax=Bombiscardovia apis TaxID=2932182 RepID=UPI0029547BC8|nr:DUF58 domain-containing protein [Bombiscardovia apis]
MSTLGPLAISLSDALGLYKRKVSLISPQPLIVCPQTVDLPTNQAVPRSGTNSSNSLTPAQAGLEFHSLRDYQPGDDLRQVHWAASARSQHLLIRLPEPELEHSSVLWLSTAASTYTNPAEFELAVSLLASIGKRETALGRRLLVHAGSLPHHSADTDDCLKYCSTLRLHNNPGLLQSQQQRDNPLLSSFSQFSTITRCYFVLGSREPRKQLLQAMEETGLGNQSAGAVVIIASLGSETSSQILASLPSIRISRLEELPQLLEAL